MIYKMHQLILFKKPRGHLMQSTIYEIIQQCGLGKENIRNVKGRKVVDFKENSSKERNDCLYLKTLWSLTFA